MGSGLGDGFGLSTITIGACVSLYTLILAGRILGDLAVVPFVVSALRNATYSTSVLVCGFVHLGPGTVCMGSSLGDSFGLSTITDGASVGLYAFCLTSGSLGDGTSAPGVVSTFGNTTHSTSMLVRVIVLLDPIAIGMSGSLGDSIGLGSATSCASIGFYTGVLTSGSLGDGTSAPGVVSTFGNTTNSTSTLMGAVIFLDPIAIGMSSSFGNGIGLSFATNSTGVGLYTGILTGGRSCGNSVIPRVTSSFYVTTSSASVLVIVFVILCPSTIVVIVGLGDGIGLSFTTNSAGVGLYTGILTSGRSCGNSVIPRVTSSFHIAASTASVLVSFLVILCPTAIVVVTGSSGCVALSSVTDAAGTGQTTFCAASRLSAGPIAPVVTADDADRCAARVAGDGAACIVRAALTINAVGAKSSVILNLQCDLKYIALNSCITVHKITCKFTALIVNAGSKRTQTGHCFTTNGLKNIGIIFEKDTATDAIFNSRGADSYGKGLTTGNCAGGSINGYVCGLGCQRRHCDQIHDQQQDQSDRNFLHSNLLLVGYLWSVGIM